MDLNGSHPEEDLVQEKGWRVQMWPWPKKSWPWLSRSWPQSSPPQNNNNNSHSFFDLSASPQVKIISKKIFISLRHMPTATYQNEKGGGDNIVFSLTPPCRGRRRWSIRWRRSSRPPRTWPGWPGGWAGWSGSPGRRPPRRRAAPGWTRGSGTPRTGERAREGLMITNVSKIQMCFYITIGNFFCGKYIATVYKIELSRQSRLSTKLLFRAFWGVDGKLLKFYLHNTNFNMFFIYFWSFFGKQEL